MHSLMHMFPNQPGLVLATTAVVVTLAIVSLVYVLLQWHSPHENLPKIGERIRFLWVLTAVFILAVVYSYKILLIYITFLAFLALKEIFSITPTRRADRRVLFWAYLSIPIQFALIWMDWRQAFIVFMPVYVFVVLPMIMVIVGETRGFAKAWSTLGWGVLTTVFSLGYLAYILMLPAGADFSAGGAGLFLFLVGLAQFNYAAQFVFGKLFDNPRLRLKVSTTRNWASLVGSIVVTIPLAWLIAPLITPFTAAQAIAVGAMISAGAFAGYIILSAIKGDLQLKDRGTMTPGHGGVLNRIDAVVYTAPLYFYIVSSLYY